MSCNTARARKLSVLGACLVSVMTATVAFAKTEKPPEVDADGLHLVKSDKSGVVYKLPGATLAGYDAVLLVDCLVEFRKNWMRDYNRGSVDLQSRVNQDDVDRIKKGLAEEFNKVFTKVLTEDGFKVVEERGENVLVVRPAIINLDVTAPDMKRSGPGNTWVRSAGEMTLYAELYNAANNELIGRVLDAEADPDNMAQIANSVTNRAAADAILRDWAKRLSKHLQQAGE